MKNRSKLRLAATLWLMAIIMVGASCTGTNTNTNNTATTTPTPDPCTTITDTEIVNNIYAEVAKFKDLRGQIDQINVISTSRQITLWGWVLTEDQRTQVVNIAQTSKCVTPPAIAEDFYFGAENPTRPQGGGGCNPDYIRCGDICIPKNTGCSLEALVSATPAGGKTNPITATNTNAKANTTTNTKTNSNIKTNSNSY